MVTRVTFPSPSSQAVGDRIKAARSGARLSQGDLAEKLGVKQATISSWETGARSPGLDDLFAIAGALQIEVVELLPTTNRRPVRAALRAVAETLDRGGLSRALDALLDAADQQPRPTRLLWPRTRHPQSTTDELIHQLGIQEPPVDIGAVANACGIPIIYWPSDNESLSGLAVDTPRGPLIAVHEGHHLHRQRFTIAHELGHIVMGHLDAFHLDLSVPPSQSGEPPNYNWLHERAANDFAANLLMPVDFVRSAFRETNDEHQLAERFNVSELAMSFRLANLGLQ